MMHQCRASQVVLEVKNLLANARDVKKGGFNPWVGKIPWSRAWQPTPVLLPGKSCEKRSLVGYTVHSIAKSGTQLRGLST